jgi:hypothetical protein
MRLLEPSTLGRRQIGSDQIVEAGLARGHN